MASLGERREEKFSGEKELVVDFSTYLLLGAQQEIILGKKALTWAILFLLEPYMMLNWWEFSGAPPMCLSHGRSANRGVYLLFRVLIIAPELLRRLFIKLDYPH